MKLLSYSGSLSLLLCANANLPSANIIIFYNSLGSYANFSNPLILGRAWDARLKYKLSSDSSWPFNATIEFFDAQSSASKITSICKSRFGSRILPNVTVILGPYANSNGKAAAIFANSYQLPIVFQGCPAYAFTNNVVNQLSYFKTSYFVLPPSGDTFNEAINAYEKVGVSSLVVVYVSTSTALREANACLGAAALATDRGIEVLEIFNYYFTNTTDELFKIVENVKYLNPDAVIWCEEQVCNTASRAGYHSLPLFKRANYMPKALTYMDCLDYAQNADLYAAGMYDFVSAAQTYNAKVGGPSYTEDATPYSSLFRPQTPVNLTV